MSFRLLRSRQDLASMIFCNFGSSIYLVNLLLLHMTLLPPCITSSNVVWHSYLVTLGSPRWPTNSRGRGTSEVRGKYLPIWHVHQPFPSTEQNPACPRTDMS